MDSITSAQSDKAQVVRRSVNCVLPILLITLIVLTIGLVTWGFSERQQESQLAESIIGDDCSKADLSAFKSAFESGNYEEVRSLFTEDGVLTTTANVHSAIFRGDISQLADRVDEKEFRRLATLHGGEDFQILGQPIQVGNNAVAFGWKWGDWVSGTALLHLREGKIVIAILNPSQYSIPFGGER